MPRADRLLLLLLASGALAAAPTVALANGPAAPGLTAADAAGDGGDAPADDGSDGGATPDDPFCAVDDPVGDDGSSGDGGNDVVDDSAGPSTGDAGPSTGDDATDPAADVVAPDEGDDAIADDGADDEDVSDVCGTDPSAPVASASPSRQVVLSLATVLRTGSVPVGAVTLPSAGLLTESLTLAPGARHAASRSAAARRGTSARGATVASGRRQLARAATVRVPLRLTPAGRSSLRRVRGDVRLTLRTTLRLTSGPQRTQTQVVVLRHRGSKQVR